MNRDAILEVKHLSKSFGANAVLKDIDFVVHPGDVTSIIGSSGSGKSTLLRCINLLETPTSGDVVFHGDSVVDKKVNAAAYRAKVGMVFQSFNLFNNMSVLENCIIGQTKVLKRNKEEAKEKELKASLENAEVAAKNPVFAEPIVKQYEDLKLATQKKSEELKELYGIETEMGDLAVAINTHRSKMASMDEEYQQKKTELDSELDKKQAEVKEQIAELDKSVRKAKSAADEEIAEYNAELHKKREREADEYEYKKKLNHRIDDDEWAAEKAQRETEIQAQENAIKAREDVISEKEDEIQAMKEQIDAFPDKLAEAKEEAAREAKAKADKSFAFEKRSLEADKKHAEEMADAKIANLEAQVAALREDNAKLSEKLDDAYKKMNDVATATVQAGATVKVVSSNDK